MAQQVLAKFYSLKYKHQGVSPLPLDACQTTPLPPPPPTLPQHYTTSSLAAHTNSKQGREGTL